MSPKQQWVGLSALAFVAYACCDLLHEAGHALAAQLPLGVIAWAVGFGAMIGLTLLPRLLARKVPATTLAPTLQPGWGWLLGGALAAAVFVAVFGPGISLIR